jgi:hypothetical protein
MTRYEQGFLTKCAEYGIDGRELLKHAGFGSNAAQFANAGYNAVKNFFTRGGKLFVHPGRRVSKKAVNESTDVLKRALKYKLNDYGNAVYDKGKDVLGHFDPRTTRGAVNLALTGTGVGAIGVAHNHGKKLKEIHQAYGF